MENGPTEQSIEANQDSDALEENLDTENIQDESTQEAIMEPEGLDSTDVNALIHELEETRAQADEYLDGWQRARAEFVNYKKRVEREQASVYQMAAGNIIRQYLEVLDDLELALKNRPPEGQGGEWADVIELIYRKFNAILENEGVKPMDVEGQLFDPNQHEAISSEVDDNHDSGEIIEVVKKGYLIGNRILRPAVVRVAQ